MSRRISPKELALLIGGRDCPLIVDVRRREIFEQSPIRIAGAIWRNHMASEWLDAVGVARPIVAYCAHGHNVSEIAASLLGARGADVAVLDGGIEAYEAVSGLLVKRCAPGVDVATVPSVWVARERPTIDGIACSWLIRRFVDPLARFHFVASEWVRDVADELEATPLGFTETPDFRGGETSNIKTMIETFGLKDPALDQLATIVRGADTASLDLAPEAAGLLAVSTGLSAIEGDDLQQMEQGLLLYDALYGWCRQSAGETSSRSARVA